MFEDISLAVVAVAGADGDVELYAMDRVSLVDARETSRFGTLGECSDEMSVSVDGAPGYGRDGQIVAEVRRRFEAARLRDSRDAPSDFPDAPDSVVTRDGRAFAAGDGGFTAVGGSL